MLGPAFCFTVLDKALAQLKAGAPADQTKAKIIEDHRPFANLGVLGPLLRDYTPLSPDEFSIWRETRELEKENFTELPPEQLTRLMNLHRRALMVGYGELFLQVQTQWPLLAGAYALLDELDQIAADEDLLALNAKKDEIDALGDALKSADSNDDGDGNGDQSAEAEEPFNFTKEKELVDELNVLFRPFLQTEPDPNAQNPEAATLQAFIMTLPATWRESELMRWRRSGEFARSLLQRAGDDPRLQAYAYGYMVHVAAAVTSQPFVNAIAGGPYRSHWWRQRLISNYVDSWTLGYYAAGATMTADLPDPPYEDWADLGADICAAKLYDRIDLGIGVSGMGLIDAVLGKTADDADVAQPTSPELELLANFLSETATDVYGDDGTLPLIPLDIAHDFTPEAFRRAYIGFSAVLWLQTSGEGPVCARELTTEVPDKCYENPPDWVEKIGSPPEPSKHKGTLAGSIILAILALLSLLTGGLGAAVAALAGAAGTAVVTSQTFWEELRCTLYWTRFMVRSIELKTSEFLVLTTLVPPAAFRLSGDGDISGTVGPARGGEGRPLTRTTVPDGAYPRGTDTGTEDVPHSADLGYWSYPVSAEPEGPSQAIWPSIGANRYPDFALDGAGIWRMQNGGVMAPASFPSRTGSVGEPLYFGNSVDNAVQVIRSDAAGLADFNLDADRGYGWLAWATQSPNLPSRPPIDAVQPS